MSYGSPATDLTLVPVTTHTLSGNITVPAGATIDRVSLGIGTSNHTTLSPALSYSVSVPDDVPSAVRMSITASGALNGATILRSIPITSATLTQDIVIGEQVVLLAPVDGANAPASQVFAVQKRAGSIAYIRFEWSFGDPDSGETFYNRTVYLNGDSITLAELRAAMVDLPSRQTAEWSAVSWAPVASMDGFFAPDRDGKMPLESSYALSRAVTFAD